MKQEVEDGVLDLGVVIEPVDEEQFDIIPLLNEELMLFVHSAHPLVHKEIVEMQDLKMNLSSCLVKTFLFTIGLFKSVLEPVFVQISFMKVLNGILSAK